MSAILRLACLGALAVVMPIPSLALRMDLHGHGKPARSYVSFGGHGGAEPASAPAVAQPVWGWGPVHGGHAPAHAPAQAPEPVAHPKYEFKYGVHDAHTGDVKDAKEERDGDVVKGEYSLLQPDGTKRTVHYTADHHNGFNAVVSISGHAVHPEQPKIIHTALDSVKPLLMHLPVVPDHRPVPTHGGATSYVSGGLIAHAAPSAPHHYY